MRRHSVFLWTFLIWVLFGALWLLPQKIRVMKRLGTSDNDDVIRLAKAGDEEAARVVRNSKRYVIGGLMVLLPLLLLRYAN